MAQTEAQTPRCPCLTVSHHTAFNRKTNVIPEAALASSEFLFSGKCRPIRSPDIKVAYSSPGRTAGSRGKLPLSVQPRFLCLARCRRLRSTMTNDYACDHRTRESHNRNCMQSMCTVSPTLSLYDACRIMCCFVGKPGTCRSIISLR